MTRGKVVLVPFPFDDLATQKARLTVTSSTIKRELGILSPGLQARVFDAVRRLFAPESDDAGGREAEPTGSPED
jgi:hypothetical protein